MEEIIINALYHRILAEPEQMTIEQVPIPYREKVEELLAVESTDN